MENTQNKRKSKEYRRKLNDILATSMKITESVAEDDIRMMQMYTILLRLQIGEALEIIGEKNHIKE